MNLLQFSGFILSTSPPIQKITHPIIDKSNINVSILRCDLIHPQLSGNKWYKLKYNLLKAENNSEDVLLSFGGAWSNHIHALSAAGKLFGFKTIGAIRGEAQKNNNACLTDAQNNGMQLHWMSRQDYKLKTDPEKLAELRSQLGDFYIIPEGGANSEGIKGCAEILPKPVVDQFDLLCLACGTGTTLAGIVSNECPPILGFQVLKGQGYLKKEIEFLLKENNLCNMNYWDINEDYHFGGYAKTTTQLLTFIKEIELYNDLLLEPVYSGKMLYAVVDMIKKNLFSTEKEILLIHGGGTQGRRGFKM